MQGIVEVGVVQPRKEPKVYSRKFMKFDFETRKFCLAFMMFFHLHKNLFQRFCPTSPTPPTVLNCPSHTKKDAGNTFISIFIHTKIAERLNCSIVLP